MNELKWNGEEKVTWVKVLNEPVQFDSHYKIIPTEGYLAWEYNPLRNYRLSLIMYEKDGKYYTKSEFEKITNFDFTNKDLPEGWTLYEAGELVDFITDELSFNIQNPVDILPLYSYDGSVNLIINDGLNIPRLINNRFTVTGKNTYKIIDRKGDNDTNIYDLGELFDIDTSLFKNVNKIPLLEYLGTSTGNMSIGNYHFYFKYADADGNESDWVAESGLVSVFIGNTPYSINTGVRDENSIKSVRFRLSNIDLSYSYVKIYYTRYSADIDGNLIVQARRIDKNFLVSNSGTCMILITGDENTTEVTLEEINSSFDVISNALTQCSAANRLFMANIHKQRIEYDKLSKLSLCFCPYKHEEVYPLSDDGMDHLYVIKSNSDGYYDTKYIYDKTGYWPGELYRLGIVYILKDGSLSPVFNIRGATDLPVFDETFYAIYNKFKLELEKGEDADINNILNEIEFSEENYLIVGGNVDKNENAKGVILLSEDRFSDKPTPFPVLSIDIRTNHLVIEELKKYTKGFFFVRQKRMPLTMAQGIVVGLDKESRTPTLPTLGGVINNLNLNNSFVETLDINDINFISEGFLSRYLFSIEPKKMGIGKKIAIAIGAAAIAAAGIIGAVFTGGAAAVAAGVALGAIFSAVGVAGIVAVSVAGAIIVTSAVVIGTQAAVLGVRRRREKRELQAIKGRWDVVPENHERKEKKESRILSHDISERYIIKDGTKNTAEALIVPDYQVNQPYYNLFLTGESFVVKLLQEQPITNFLNDGYFESFDRHFYVSKYILQSDTRSYNVKLVGVPDSCPVKMINNHKYSARAGCAEEAYKYEFQGVAYDDSINQRDNSDIIRGNFGSYVGMKDYQGHTSDQVKIMIPGYKENELFSYVLLRALDTSAFFAISDRIDINNINKNDSFLEQSEKTLKDFNILCYRGDSYICQYTHRINRNFNDPSAPYNDVIVDKNTWKDNYDPDNKENYADINLGDVNAVLLGLWLTFWVRSNYNLNIRTIDKSHVDEYLMCGNHRSYYPHYGLLADGYLKIPDSEQYNKGFSKSVSEKYYFEVPDVPYIKLEFLNRIVFSDIHINDAYKNGFRVFRTMNHKDYPMTYGSITKILEWKNLLLLVFEHGIGGVGINNSAQHSSQILSDLSVISPTYGSLWKDSIIKTPTGIYGIDTVAKKIWKLSDLGFELISDMRVLEFLNSNISLTERELTPILGVRNVKTLYNAHKQDVIFTFYDNLQGFKEKAWSLCWNEALNIFTTFYSWIPSNMENIDNIPFSFNRDVTKYISKLGVSKHDNDYSSGITLSNNITDINNPTINSSLPEYTFINKLGEVEKYKFEEFVQDENFIGYLYLDDRTLPDGKVPYTITYELLFDIQLNYKMFEIKSKVLKVLKIKDIHDNDIESVEVYYLAFKSDIDKRFMLSELYYRNNLGHSYADYDINKLSPINNEKSIYPINANYTIHIDKPIFKNTLGLRLTLPLNELINADKIVRYINIKAKINIILENNQPNAIEAYYKQFTNSDLNVTMIDSGYFESTVAIMDKFNTLFLSCDFWKHGQAGIFDITEKVFPTQWYGLIHPFEFEIIAIDNPYIHKIFTNLEIISNNVKPESFHYEVIGDTYDFAEDKPTMYFRQEALKALYQYNGYDIEYDPTFILIDPKQSNNSADLPKYYSRQDSLNTIYDTYKRFHAPNGFNYDHLSGSEIVYYPNRNEYRIWNHVEAIDANSMILDKNGSAIETSILKANCRYLEDKWLVTINPIVVTYKNEVDFVTSHKNNESMFTKDEVGVYKYSTWVKGYNSDKKLPPINLSGTTLDTELSGEIQFPQGSDGKDNSLYHLYDLTEWNKGDWKPIDPNKNSLRKETDVRGKFIKIRIRYSGKDLAIIDFLNTVYQISFT